ncbi:MAG TPA: 16S rRNA (uracil(1498)-N(3))-methyltransferase [Mycobacteriales bacterium]
MSDAVFLVDALPAPGRFVLGGPEGRHAAAVRRMRAGERLLLADGAGGLAAATVVAAGRDTVDLDVAAATRERAPEPRLVVVQALPKGDRGELAVQVMTEAGVDEIVPWQASRCVTRWQGDRGRRSWQRWQSVAREAAKQARRSWVPVLAEPATTPQVAARLTGAAAAYVLHEEAAEPLATLAPPSAGEIVLVVGPEGGVAPEELAAFTAAGARAVRLGPTVLRTSTAGVAALAVVNAATGRWG